MCDFCFTHLLLSWLEIWWQCPNNGKTFFLHFHGKAHSGLCWKFLSSTSKQAREKRRKEKQNDLLKKIHLDTSDLSSRRGVIRWNISVLVFIWNIHLDHILHHSNGDERKRERERKKCVWLIVPIWSREERKWRMWPTTKMGWIGFSITLLSHYRDSNVSPYIVHNFPHSKQLNIFSIGSRIIVFLFAPRASPSTMHSFGNVFFSLLLVFCFFL